MKKTSCDRLKMRKQSSRASFDARRDTVKLSFQFLVNVYGGCENKVAVPPSIPQQTTMKLNWLEFLITFGQIAQSESKFLSRQWGPPQNLA